MKQTTAGISLHKRLAGRAATDGLKLPAIGKCGGRWTQQFKTLDGSLQTGLKYPLIPIHLPLHSIHA